MNIDDKAPLSAAEYVLGLTDDKTRRELTMRLYNDAEFASEVQRWQKAFSGIDVNTIDVNPPLETWYKIEQEISQKNTSVIAFSKHPASWLGWALAAAMAGLVVYNNVLTPETVSEPQPIAVLSGTQQNEQFVVSLNSSSSKIQVSALNVTLPQDKNLELWLIKDKNPPRPLGLITTTNRNVFQLPPGPLNNHTVLAISLEPIGGSKQSGPSGPVVFQGKISTL